MSVHTADFTPRLHDKVAILRDAGCPPAPSLYETVRHWYADRQARIECRRSRSSVPEGLRRDVGLDVSLPSVRAIDGGRTFLVNNRPDATLSGYYW